jgi:predicted aspartyl protease
MRIALMLAATAAVAAVPLSAQPTRTTEFDSVAQPHPVDSESQTEDVDFRNDRHDRMTVAVRLGGNGPYRFLVDTGADRTAISRELAARLKLEPAGVASLHSVTGVSRVETARVPSLQLTRKEVKVANAPLLSSTHMGADGILGVDSLRSQRVLFDFKAKTMSIVPSAERAVRDEEGTIVVQARERNGRLILSRASADGVTVPVVLDTGSEISVGNEALRRKLSRDRKALARMGTVELTSVTGHKLVGEYMILKRLEIGGIVLTNLAIVFADAHTFRRIGLDDKPAVLLGMNAISAFDKVSIDFANKKLRLLMPEHSDSGTVLFASRTFSGG